MLDTFNLFQDSVLPFPPHSSLFSPSGGDIDSIHGIGEGSCKGITTMGNGVCFQEAGTGFIPLVGLNGDLFTQQGAWFRGGSTTSLVGDASGLQ